MAKKKNAAAVELDRKAGKVSGQKLTEKRARSARAMEQAKEVEVRKLR